MVFSGKVYDKETRKGIPNASIKIMTGDGRYTGVGVATNNDGSFKISSAEIVWPNYAVFSAVGYESAAWELYEDFVTDIELFLNRDVKELDPVVITSDKKNNYGLLILAAIAIASTKKKKSAVGEIGFNMPTILTGVAIYAAFKSFDILDQLLSVFGLGKDKDDKNFDQENADPESPLKPNLYINAPKDKKQKAYQTVSAKATNLGQRLFDAFGGLNDDEAAAIGVFKNFSSKIEASCFAYIWEEEWQYPDLLQWLKGDSWPNDRLDTGEISEIIKYLDNLPTY